MTPIPNKFNGRADQKGYEFTLLKRQGDVCLFQKVKRGFITYEVVVLEHRAKRTWPDGRVTEARESMPSPEQWGVRGYSPYDLTQARQKFNEWVERELNRYEIEPDSDLNRIEHDDRGDN